MRENENSGQGIDMVVAVDGDSEAGTTLVLANDPGYVVAGGSGKMAYFQGRSWQGETVVEIVTKAAWSASR